MKISVLAVGTELTTGQINNKNSSWISKQLKDLGVLTSLHLTVPDDRPLVLESLEICANHSDVIFVTGGLGPTSDDFTRDVIAQWTGRNLEWHEPSWQHVVERLSSRGYAVRDFQKQQCFFPAGATILENDQGTAHGFSVEHKNKMLFVLPGPPREIEAIWMKNISSWLEEKTANLDRHITLSWDTLGYGESELAKWTEEALMGSDLEIGYRVHLPYVEVKVSFLKSQEKAIQVWLEKLEEKIGAMTFLRNGEDAAQKLCQILKKFPQIQIYDEAGGSFLFTRLETHLRPLLQKNKISFYNFISSEGIEMNSTSESLILFIRKQEENRVQVGFGFRGQWRETIFESPVTSALMSERRRQYFVEMALFFWMQHLQDL